MILSILQKTRRTELTWIIIAATIGILIAVRIYCATIYRVDSDEPQHLHVVWGITKGLVQYRDIFDNHSPLFQLLSAPLFRALGERPDILIGMRMAMIPFYLGCLACIYLISAPLFSRRCAILATVLTALHWRFFCTSLEFRPDNLWAFNWLLLLTVLIRVRHPSLRWLLAGILAGIGFSISMKTTVMMMDLAGAGALTWLICKGAKPSIQQAAQNTGLFIAGLAIVPASLAIYFAAKGALIGNGTNNLFYCLIQHNLIAASKRAHFLTLREIVSLGAFFGMIWWSARVYRMTDNPQLAVRRVFILLSGALYPVILFVLWPLITREDFLALMPMMGMAAASVLIAALEKIHNRSPRLAWCSATIPACLIATEIGMDLYKTTPWRDRTELHEQFIANTCKLAAEGEYVMDSKGEMIFHPRPYFYVLEEMTRWKLKEQIIQDDIPERMITHSVCIAAKNGERYPKRTAQFLKENYIPVAFRLLVAGKILTPDPVKSTNEFQLAIPTEYALVWPSTPGQALLDGHPYTTPLKLEPGPHTLQILKGEGPVAIVWSKAPQRGFCPFYKPSEEEKRETQQAIHDNIL